MFNKETGDYIAKAYEPENRSWTTFCNLWEMITDKYAREKLAAPLHRARRAGCDVLENPRVMESMEMACEGVVP